MVAWHFFKMRLDRIISVHRHFARVAKRAKYILSRVSAEKIERDAAKQFHKIERGEKMIAEAREAIGGIIFKKSERVSDTEQVLKSLAKAYHPDVYKKIWEKGKRKRREKK